jgi:hypothetical protein
LRENHCFFENRRASYWSGFTFIWVLSLVLALIGSTVVPITEKNHREVPTHKIEEGNDKYEGVFIAKEEIQLKKVDKFCKRAVMYEDYSFFGLKLCTSSRFEY